MYSTFQYNENRRKWSEEKQSNCLRDEVWDLEKNSERNLEDGLNHMNINNIKDSDKLNIFCIPGITLSGLYELFCDFIFTTNLCGEGK